MTREDLINALIAYAGDDFDRDNKSEMSFLEFTVDDAIEEVVNTMYPYVVTGETEEETEELLESHRRAAMNKYGHVIRRIAMFHYDKQGKEGVTTFYESGQTTSYKGGGTPSEYLASVIPVAIIL